LKPFANGRDAASDIEIVVYERNPDVSGTWLLNHYPGAECDVPSHFYCFSFAPNPNWSAYYSPQVSVGSRPTRAATVPYDKIGTEYQHARAFGRIPRNIAVKLG
jgi:hypothetical protein